MTPAQPRRPGCPGRVRGILAAVPPAGFDTVVLIARRRSFRGELFHRGVTARERLRSAMPVLPAQE
ncbi:hypothetical protein [Hymenobacter sp.]|uniref:hypothetical protein n=1 Tax=Hymenobacter sp. TaxID=1898978 RepID=UPI00286C5F41|nr:hypothetical protein [Hymenobacter sp.]